MCRTQSITDKCRAAILAGREGAEAMEQAVRASYARRNDRTPEETIQGVVAMMRPVVARLEREHTQARGKVINFNAYRRARAA